MNQQQKQVKVDLSKTTPWTCDECGNEVFNAGLLLRKVSRFLSGDAQDGMAPVQTFYCVKCGHVNNDFYPPELAITENDEKNEE
jgi:predicted nucleic-acid-binding Zn-ribbon protein